MIFGTRNIRSMNRVGSVMIVSRSCTDMLNEVGVQEVRWEDGGTEPEGEYMFFYGKGKENHELGTDFFFVRELNQQLRGKLVMLGKQLEKI
jgi:hypothetical protein